MRRCCSAILTTATPISNDRVNLADYNKLAGNFVQFDRLWVHGDSTYNGLVNLADFNELAPNFGLESLGHPDPSEDEGEGEGFQSYTYEDLLALLMQMYPELF